MRIIYLTLAFLGFVLPYSQFLPWLATNGFDFSLFITHLWANAISRFFALDVIVSAVVLFCFIFNETKQNKIPKAWLAIVGTLCIGVSFGLPLFLYLRELAKTHCSLSYSKNVQQI